MVADLLPAWLTRYNKKHGTSWTTSDLTQWEIWNDLGCTSKEIFSHLTPDIYRDEVQPINGAVDVVNALRRMGHDVVFITSCYTRDAAIAKTIWLIKHGFLSEKEDGWWGGDVLPIGPWSPLQSKSQVPSDWLVDDHAGNIKGRKGGVLLTRPHNCRIEHDGLRVASLDDFYALVTKAAA